MTIRLSPQKLFRKRDYGVEKYIVSCINPVPLAYYFIIIKSQNGWEISKSYLFLFRPTLTFIIAFENVLSILRRPMSSVALSSTFKSVIHNCKGIVYVTM